MSIEFIHGLTGRTSASHPNPSHTAEPALPARRHRYLEGLVHVLRVGDLLVIMIAVAVASVLHGRASGGAVFGWGTQSLLLVGAAACWMAMLHLHNAYDTRLTGHGIQEYRNVFMASIWHVSLIVILAYAFTVEISRVALLALVLLGTLGLLTGRWLARCWLVRQRDNGLLCDRVLVVGPSRPAADLIAALHRTPAAGYRVVGACVDGGAEAIAGVSVLGEEADVLGTAIDMGVDTVAVSSSARLGPDGLRQLSHALECTSINLVVAPGLVNVEGQRILTRPVDGLPLIHVDPPRFVGPDRMLKSVLDRIGAALLILVLAPVMAFIALRVHLGDRGPALFRQDRVGHGGETFPMLKFRTMVVDAEARLGELQSANNGAGPMFKMRDDPRITPIGAHLRRFSLDELPQLFNVLRGQMSLVGPRPPLLREVADYEDEVRRKFLVKPGMTGLWQISGRSDLSWEEAVRLDLYYVENWTPLLDVMILWRTIKIVASPGGKGAY